MTAPEAKLLWAKHSTSIDDRIQRFLAGEDVLLDRHLLPYDIEATRAHVRGLARIDALTREQAAQLDVGLNDLAAAFADGSFVLDERYEDGHSAIETYLTERLGDEGRMVHLGRSRNDQVLVAMRLWVRRHLAMLRDNALSAADACLHVARSHEMTPMPGYTHLQRAVPSTIGMWTAAFCESFIDNASLLESTWKWMDGCPLGTAAGYGVNLPLDREGVARELGFSRVQLNPISTQNSRGQHEVQAVTAAWQLMQTIRRLAWDLSLYATSEFAFIKLPNRFTTGSSIMPNKRNPDVIELLRAAASVQAGALAELQQTLSLSSGYHRDLQFTKGPTIRALTGAEQASALVADLISSIGFDEHRMRNAIEPALHATDRAVELTGKGIPFRTAYQQVASELTDGIDRTPEQSIAARSSLGACANLGLNQLESRLSEMRTTLE